MYWHVHLTFYIRYCNGSSLERNSLVYTSLQVYEYYRSILFLTSNPISSFDGIVKSRIPIPLWFKSLDIAA